MYAKHRLFGALLIVGALCTDTLAQTPLGTVFTYQGTLSSAGAPASGTFDLRFALFNAASAGAPVGSALCADNIIVADRLDVKDLLSETAATARADLLEADAVDAASAARRDFRREAASTRERFMKDLDAVISSINRCTFEVLQRAHLAIDGMKGLDNDMNSLADIRERSKGIVSVSDLLNGIDSVTRTLRDRVSVLERDVGEALRQAEAQSEDEQRRVEAFIQSLEARRNDLRARLRAEAPPADPPEL